MKKWYVIQVYAGYEEIVRKDLMLRIKERNLIDLFGQVLVPAARLKKFFVFGQDFEDERLFPGYVLIEMENSSETLSLVSGIPRVLKFLGGKDPVPLTIDEVKRIVSQIKGEVIIAKKQNSFVISSDIEICEGPFAGFSGIIESIDEENEKLIVMVSIFGRLTPVELTFNQVKR